MAKQKIVELERAHLYNNLLKYIKNCQHLKDDERIKTHTKPCLIKQEFKKHDRHQFQFN